MRTTIRIAILLAATLAAEPVLAQSLGSANDGGGPSGGGRSGGGTERASNSLADRPPTAWAGCLRQCPPPAPPKRQPRAVKLPETCGQQLTFGRDPIFSYERCDRFM